MLVILILSVGFFRFDVNAMNIKINIGVSFDSQIILEVESGDSIDNIKQKICEKNGYPVSAQSLVYNGTVLQNGRTLADYNIQKESILDLYIIKDVTFKTDVSHTDESSDETDVDGHIVAVIKDSDNIVKYQKILRNSENINGDLTLCFDDVKINSGDKLYFYAKIDTLEIDCAYFGEPLAVFVFDYIINFDANGGNGSMPSQNVVIGSNAELSANKFTKNGAVFIGWNTQPDGKGVSYRDSQVVTNLISDTDKSVITLYAQWENVNNHYVNNTVNTENYSEKENNIAKVPEEFYSPKTEDCGNIELIYVVLFINIIAVIINGIYANQKS